MSRPQFKRVEAFNPKQISGCQLWLDSTDSSTISFSSGSSITQWNDKSGSSNHFTPTSGTPTLISDNGRSVVNFTSGAIMTSANQITFTTSSAFFIVSHLTSIGNIVGMLLGFTNINGADKSIRFYGNKILVGTVSEPGVNEYELANATYFVNGTFNPSFGSTTYLNTYSIIGTVAPSGGGTSFLTLSSSFMSRFFIGNIAEFIYYPGGVTSSQRQQVEGYLAQKWGLRSSLPGGHPGITSIIYPTPRRTATVNMTMSLRPYYTEFSPRSIAGCSMWVDGADPAGTGVQPANGATVSTWVDKSGNTNNGTSGTATFNRDSVGGFINFTGSQTYSITNPNVVVNQYFTIFVVEQLQNYAGGEAAFMGGNGSFNANLHMRYTTGGGGMKFGFFGNDLDASVTAFLTNSTQPVRIWSFSFLPSSRVIYLNGTSIGSDTNNIQISGWGGAAIGAMVSYGGQYYNGKMREVMIYSGSLITAQRQQVESYLAQKWGLASSLPAGHLNTTQPVGIPRFVTQVKQKIQSVRFLNYPTITNANSNITYGGYIFYYFTTVGNTSTAITNTGGTTINAFILGGGGGGGSWVGGGGGAGGLCMKSDLYSGPYTVTVGGGGNGGAQGRNAGAVGENSQFSTFIGYGGGGGRDAFAAGLNGGCGGGGGYGNYSGGSATQPSSASGGFGYAGGYASSGPAGGGGGIGSAGVSNYTDLGISNQNGLNGGFGYGGASNSTFLDGRAYGGGGGGGTNGNDGTYMTGGVGFSGGGNGGIGAPIGTPGAAGSPGTANTGGGGGGGGNWNGGGAQNPGGNGGSGIVILYHLL